MKRLNLSNCRPGLFCLALVLAASLLTTYVSMAIPYASQVVSNNNQVTFVLNQDAQGLVVLRDGANPVYPGATAGQHSFDMTGYTSYSIIVTGNTAKAWTQFIPDGTDRNFYYPNSVAVNKNPASTNFGKVYISNNNKVVPGNTGAGRLTTDGIFVLRADGSAINATPYTGGLSMTNDAGNYSDPFKINLNPDDDCLYFSSYFDDLAFAFNEDMSVVTQLVDDSNKTTGQYMESVYATGSRAKGNLVLYTVDSNYSDTARKGLIAYNLGANLTATASDTGSQVIGPDCYSVSPNTYYPSDVDRDSSGNWYMSTYRATAGQAPDVGKFDGSLPWPNNTFVWNSVGSHSYVRGLGLNEADGTVAVGRFTSSSGQVYFYDMATGADCGMVDVGNVARDIAFDVAGNMVSVDNSTEYARFWSPGGKSVATTRSDGTFQLSTLDNISVTSTDLAAAEEVADPAIITISRRGGNNADQLVYFTLTGTAVSNVDYTVFPASPFVFKAGETTTNITITPIDDNVRESTETVVLTLVPADNYYVSSQNSVTATISDNDLVVRYWDANGAVAGAGTDPTGTWGTDNFWSTSPDGTVATGAWKDWAQAIFSAGADWTTFTVTVSGTQKVDGPSIEDSMVTFSGGTLQLTNFSGIAVASGAQATINSVLAGVSGMAKDGPGALYLGGANTYSGPTTINDGLVQLNAAERIPNLSAVNIGATATLDLGYYDETIGSLASAAGATLNVYPGYTLKFGGDNTDTVWNGTSGSGGTLFKVGTGTTALSAGAINDPLVISNGTVSINAAGRLGSASSITIDNGAILESTSASVGSDFITSGETITIGSRGGTLKVVEGSAILMLHDASVISGVGTLTKDGAGELRTYSVEHTFGKLIVKGGLYTAGHSSLYGYNTSFGAIPATVTADAITIQNGAQIRKAGGYNITLDPKQGITVGVGGGTIRAYGGNTGAGTFEIPGPISGSGALGLNAVADAGYEPNIVLSGNNTYSGGTTVNAGIVDVRVDGGLGSGNVAVASGATLKLNSGTANAYINSAATLTLNGSSPVVNLAFTGAPNVIKALYFGTTQMPAGTWGAVGSGAANESAFFTGTGMLNVTTGNAPQPVTTMGIGSVSGGATSISYSGGAGSQFVLLRSPEVAAALSSWERVATNTASSGSFPIVVGSDPKAFYRIISE